VLATGSTSDYFGNDDLRERTLAMKTLEQAQRLRNHLLACLEHAAQSEDDAERRRWLTFVIAGGGATGVEYAGAVSEFRKLVAREYPELSDDLIRIVVVEGTDRLLPAFPPKLGRYAQQALHRLGVEVKTGALLVRIQPGVAVLSSGETLATETSRVVGGRACKPTRRVPARRTQQSRPARGRRPASGGRQARSDGDR
jgi:NADH dehydrogenase